MKNQIILNPFGKKLAITFANVDVELHKDSRILLTMHLWLDAVGYAEKEGFPPAVMIWGSNGAGILKELPTRHECFFPAPMDDFNNVVINAEGEIIVVVNIGKEVADEK